MASDSEFIERSVCCASLSGLHRMAYREWGARDNPRVLICVHGLARNGRDFDELAQIELHFVTAIIDPPGCDGRLVHRQHHRMGDVLGIAMHQQAHAAIDQHDRPPSVQHAPDD